MENVSNQKISNHAFYTFWFVIPTLPMFLVFPRLIQWVGFWTSIFVSILLTIFLFYLLQVILLRFGIQLFP